VSTCVTEILTTYICMCMYVCMFRISHEWTLKLHTSKNWAPWKWPV